MAREAYLRSREAAEYIGVCYRMMQSYISRSYPMNEASWTLAIQKARFWSPYYRNSLLCHTKLQCICKPRLSLFLLVYVENDFCLCYFHINQSLFLLLIKKVVHALGTNLVHSNCVIMRYFAYFCVLWWYTASRIIHRILGTITDWVLALYENRHHWRCLFLSVFLWSVWGSNPRPQH